MGCDHVISIEAAETISEILGGMGVAVSYFDAEDRLQAWNDAYEDVNFAIRPMIRRGAYFPDLLAELVVRNQIVDARKGANAWVTARLAARGTGETVMRRLTNGRVYAVRETRTADGGILGIWIDISACKPPAEQPALAPSTTDAQSAAMMALSGGIAHHLNNVLQVIRGNAEVARDSDSDGETGAPSRMDEIIAASERGAIVTRRLLAFGRRTTLRPETVDLNTAATEALARAAFDLPATVHADAIPRDGLWLARCDPALLGDVIDEMLANAVTAMPTSGSVLLITRNRVVTEEMATAYESAITPGRYVCLLVADTGHGMTSSTRQRAFEPFFTERSGPDAIGLGLPMIAGFAAQSGGAVRLTTGCQVGTDIEILLPEARGRGFGFDIAREIGHHEVCSALPTQGFHGSRGDFGDAHVRSR